MSDYQRDPALDSADCIHPGVVHSRILCAQLRIEDQNAEIIALLTEIRDQGKVGTIEAVAIEPKPRKVRAPKSAEEPSEVV